MLTKDVSDELQSVIESLVAQGKKPTVALVKARLKTTVPMPAIIATLKSWQSSSRVPKIEVASPDGSLDKIASLEQEVKTLSQRVTQLEAQLAKLINDEK
ncbi:DNA-binding protein [Vibrio marisflavi]|uniref:KfrA N-terminal DNA-binding domain-containing protein n=1 Tax=Vibrio marisflavi CECT 7928 TaxID=634439 RepID=A0ABN8E4A0_9VIBR|nr:DNA-binding protein [Vibrio marisflavi]CAH0538893.1 hypothetical protein VMF7928_01743 [Vibrio marisflavi CECT 7928]